jgi:hypothetical protein
MPPHCGQVGASEEEGKARASAADRNSLPIRSGQSQQRLAVPLRRGAAAGSTFHPWPGDGDRAQPLYLRPGKGHRRARRLRRAGAGAGAGPPSSRAWM